MWTLYTKRGCVPCRESKRLLEESGIEYFEKDLQQPEVLAEFKAAFPEITKAPAIFKDGVYVGGYEQLRERLLGTIESERQLLEE